MKKSSLFVNFILLWFFAFSEPLLTYSWLRVSQRCVQKSVLTPLQAGRVWQRGQLLPGVHPCSPPSAAPVLLPPLPSQQQQLVPAWLSSALVWIKWATGMWLFPTPSNPLLSAAASFAHAYR